MTYKTNNYVKDFSNAVQGYECTNDECSWQGLHEGKIERYSIKYEGNTLCCPKCGNDEFYGLKTFNKKQNDEY